MEKAVIFLLLVFLHTTWAQVGCTRIANNTWTCDWSQSSGSIGSITASSFGGETPQSLNFTNVNGPLLVSSGFLPPFTVMGSSVYYQSPKLPGVPEALYVHCTPGGTAIVTSNILSGVYFYKEIHFIDCNVNLNTFAFLLVRSVETLSITNGNFTGLVATSFQDMTFRRTNYAGKLILDKMYPPSGLYPDGVFDNSSIPYLRFLSLRYNGLTTLSRGVVEGISYLETIDLTGNHINVIETGLFDGLNGLWSIDLSELPLDCSTCQNNVWLIDWADKYSIKLKGQLLCTHPYDKVDVRLYTYNVTVCAPGPGIDPLDVIIGTFLFIALALSLAALGMSIVLKAHLSPKKKMEDGSLENLRKWSDDDEPLIDDLAPDSRPTSALSADREDPNTALLMNLQKRPATGMRKETHNKQPKEITTTTSEEEQPPAEANGSVTHGSQSATPVPPVET